MNAFWQWIAAHPTSSALMAYYVFSSLVSGMPPPTPQNGLGYVWLYNSLHTLAANALSLLFKKGYGTAPIGSAVSPPAEPR